MTIKNEKEYNDYRANMEIIIAKGTKLGDMELLSEEDKQEFIQLSRAMAEYAWTSFNQNAKVFDYPPQGKPGDERFHATQKPIALYKWILSRYAKPGDKIFDPYLGSGSSRIAAWDMGFDFVGCEIDKTYFDLMEKRFAEYTKQTRMEL